MNISSILFHQLHQFWWIPVAVIVLTIFKNPWFKGIFGEFLINIFTTLLLDKKVYRLLHNVTLTTPDGTTQIDHVIVSPFGIFVVETKNYQGWIFGSAEQATWTQKIYKKTHKFQNPLRQNYKHVKALEALLGVSLENIHSVIVFIGGSSFKTPMPANVTQGLGYINFIKAKKVEIFSHGEVEEICQTITTGRLKPSLATSREHVANLKRRDNLNETQLCPKCGSTMLLRTIKSGVKQGNKFWGCSGFPKCRTVRAIPS